MSATLACRAGPALAARPARNVSARRAAPATVRAPLALRRGSLQVVRAGDKDWTDEDDAEFEARLAALKTAKGQTPMGQGKKNKKANSDPEVPKYVPKTYSFEGEEVYYEGPPARGDLAVNVALGFTLLWLPLTIASITRGIFISYKFTNKRFSVETNAPWQKEKTDVAYQEVAKVVSIPRGIGLWGDMVVTLRNGDKVELRSLEKFKELEKYILQRKAELTGEPIPDTV